MTENGTEKRIYFKFATEPLVIALANKLARIAWAVLARGHAYQARSASHAV